MALPPWTVELLRRGVADLARQVTDPEMVQTLRDQTSKVVEELPRVAREKVDSILRAAESGVAPFRSAWAAATLPPQPSRLINGSGQLDDPLGSGIAIAPEVLSAGLMMLGGEVRINASRSNHLLGSITDRLPKAAGESLDVVVMNSFESAIASLVPLSRRGGTMLIPRCCARPMSAAGSPILADQLRALGASSVREVGSTDSLSIKDLLSSVQNSGRTNHLIRLDRDSCSLDVETLRENHVQQFVVMPHGRLLPPPIGSSTSDAIRSATDRIAQGADAVVLGGGIWTGTPELGFIIGRREVVASLKQSSRLKAALAPPAYISMVDAAIKLHSSVGLPVDNLVAVSVDNLKDRAERLATQIAGISGVHSVRVTNHATIVRISDSGSLNVPSNQVVWAMDAEQTQRLLSSLRSSDPILLLREVEGTVGLDLRFVTPDQQSQVHQLLSSAVPE